MKSSQPTLAFSKECRLLHASEYKRVFDQVDTKVGNQHFLCLSRKNALGKPRLGLIIAKKQVKLSVGRNRIKRIVRDSFRQHQTELPAFDIIFLSRNGVSSLDNRSLHEALNTLWKRLKKQHDRSL